MEDSPKVEHIVPALTKTQRGSMPVLFVMGFRSIAGLPSEGGGSFFPPWVHSQIRNDIVERPTTRTSGLHSVISY